jgi:hypothetical protein
MDQIDLIGMIGTNTISIEHEDIRNDDYMTVDDSTYYE